MKTLIPILIFLTYNAFGQDGISELKRLNLDSIVAATFKRDSLRLLHSSDSVTDMITSRIQLDSFLVKKQLDSCLLSGSACDTLILLQDSLAALRTRLTHVIKERTDSLVSAHRSRLNRWAERFDKIFSADTLSNITNPSLPNQFNIPAGAPALPNELETPLSDLSALIPEDVKALETHRIPTDVMSVDQMAETAEQLLIDKSKISSLNGELQEMDQLPLDQLSSEEAAKDMLKERLTEESIDHFAGQEVALKAAIDKVATYKQKYSNVKSIKDVQKPPVRWQSLKDKPFVERVVPGIAMQMMRNEAYIIDVNGYIGYLIEARLVVGGGWMQRVAYDGATGQTNFSSVYGPRFFASVYGWRSFSLRTEFEWLRTDIPNRQQIVGPDKIDRSWVFTPLIGVKKDVRLFRNCNGIAILMFNVYNPLKQSPYKDLIYSRVGFEFSFKKTRPSSN